MMSPLPTFASRRTAWALVWLLLLPWTVAAREFTVRTLSDPAGNARSPSIGDSGLIAWQGYSLHASIAPLHERPDVLEAPPGSWRSDIYVWRNGAVENVTGGDARLTGRSERPTVFDDAIIFLAWFRNDVGGGFPLDLSIPPKTEAMSALEGEYATLFEPLELKSALEIEAAAGETNAPPPAGEAAPGTKDDDDNLQTQIWRRSSDLGGDIAVYRSGEGVTRISPGLRHYCTPVMSAAGIAFQCARGWPYGYEMLAWKTGATNLLQLTTNYFYVLNPDLHGNELVFQGWDGDDYEIFRYNFDTDQLEQLTNNQFDDIQPVVWNGKIAWIAHPTITAEIFFLSDGVIRKISEGTSDNAAPSIWEGRVVWQGYDDTDLEIYYFNGRRTIKLTSNTWDDLAPRIRAGLVTWMSYVENWDAEIMALDLGDNIAVQLTDNEYEDAFPQTAGEKIVWQTITETGATVQLAEPAAPRAESIP